MIEWSVVTGSTRIVAEAYDAENERILVRFPNGVEWAYSACPQTVWAEFTAVGQSRGQYISTVLNFKPHCKYVS
jgi:hypothetical protein